MFSVLQTMLVLVAAASGVNARALQDPSGELQASGRELNQFFGGGLFPNVGAGNGAPPPPPDVTTGVATVAVGSAEGEDGAGGLFITGGEADEEGAAGGALTYLVAGGESAEIAGGAGTVVTFNSEAP